MVASMLAITMALRPTPQASAHCDSINGPVVTAARQALAAGDVTLILPYVAAAAEAELTGAFQHALTVRPLGSEAQALADRYFFETAVRLHRAGEGAPYTGLKEGDDESPALAAADRALAGGSLDQVYAVLSDAIQNGVAQRYQGVVAARAHAAQEGTVAAARERVEAELGFDTYVEAVYATALGLAAPAVHPPGDVHAQTSPSASCS